jgi:small-conductance mechanosensitive channel
MTARRREDTGLFALVTGRLAVTGVLVAVAVVPILLPVPGLALSLLNYIVLTLGFLLALGALGLDLTKLTILAGAFGVGLGFGLQSVVNNFVSGLLLLSSSGRSTWETSSRSTISWAKSRASGSGPARFVPCGGPR